MATITARCRACGSVFNANDRDSACWGFLRAGSIPGYVHYENYCPNCGATIYYDNTDVISTRKEFADYWATYRFIPTLAIFIVLQAVPWLLLSSLWTWCKVALCVLGIILTYFFMIFANVIGDWIPSRGACRPNGADPSEVAGALLIALVPYGLATGVLWTIHWYLSR